MNRQQAHRHRRLAIAAPVWMLLLATVASAQSRPLNPAPCPDGACAPNTFNFGYYQTNWRRWPTSPLDFSDESAAAPQGGPSLPAVETPAPRFEGQLAPPLRGPAVSPPDEAPPMELFPQSLQQPRLEKGDRETRVAARALLQPKIIPPLPTARVPEASRAAQVAKIDVTPVKVYEMQPVVRGPRVIESVHKASRATPLPQPKDVQSSQLFVLPAKEATADAQQEKSVGQSNSVHAAAWSEITSTSSVKNAVESAPCLASVAPRSLIQPASATITRLPPAGDNGPFAAPSPNVSVDPRERSVEYDWSQITSCGEAALADLTRVVNGPAYLSIVLLLSCVAALAVGSVLWKRPKSRQRPRRSPATQIAEPQTPATHERPTPRADEGDQAQPATPLVTQQPAANAYGNQPPRPQPAPQPAAAIPAYVAMPQLLEIELPCPACGGICGQHWNHA